VGAGGSTAGAAGSAGKSGTGGSGGTSGTGGSGGTTSTGAFTLTAAAWVNMAGCAANMAASCATLPKELTRTGGGVGTSPALSWTGVPAGTKSFALVLQDLSGNSTHWVLWNIPGTTTSLAADVDQSTPTPAVPAGSQQCSKDPAAGAEGYYGPGACGNVYEFALYALSVATFSPTMATNEIQVRTQLLALGSSILGTAATRGRTFAPNCP
jgi:Raf kinase inhibitor-like YbhB/YbcL family protein